jgi:DNA polymerase-3 subunit chi
MTGRVDFYVLKSSAAKQRLLLACRLAEKAYMKQLTAVIANESLAEAQALDDLLWTFSDRSFVPHGLCLNDADADPGTPIRITVGAQHASPADLLVNLTASLPPHAERYARIIEIIDADAERKRLGRERFKAYRESKFTLDTHQLNETADV